MSSSPLGAHRRRRRRPPPRLRHFVDVVVVVDGSRYSGQRCAKRSAECREKATSHVPSQLPKSISETALR
eukprot:4028860-Pyramimonas_sp.AAC.1